jgi:hypothetical protein
MPRILRFLADVVWKLKFPNNSSNAFVNRLSLQTIYLPRNIKTIYLNLSKGTFGSQAVADLRSESIMCQHYGRILYTTGGKRQRYTNLLTGRIKMSGLFQNRRYLFIQTPPPAVGEHKGPGGRPPFDYVMMFKILILQGSYTIGDAQAEYQIKDRLSFMRRLTGRENDRGIPGTLCTAGTKDEKDCPGAPYLVSLKHEGDYFGERTAPAEGGGG